MFLEKLLSGVNFMYYNKVEICGVDTSKLKVLKESEKMELLKRYKAGDKSARKELLG